MKLIIPMKRECHNPQYIACGTAVGLFCGLTPIVWQMNAVFIIWFIARLFKFHFSLPIGLAWTWVSEFMGFFQNGIIEGIKQTFIFWGKPILFGSFIYMVLFSTAGYFISYKYACRLRDKYIARRINNKNLEGAY